MMEQVVTWTGIAILIVWLVVLLASQILYLIASFKASAGLTILSMFVPFVGIYVLVRFWEELKRPFLNQVVVTIGGLVLVLIGGMTIKSMGMEIPSVLSAPQPEEKAPPPTIQWIPATGAPDRGPPEARGVEVPVRGMAVVTVPQDWSAIPWDLPDLAVAMGHAERGEYVTVHVLEKNAAQSFAGFQEAALQDVLQHLIDGRAPSEPHQQTVHGCETVTISMSGRSRLPDQAGQPVSTRLSCIDGTRHRYFLVQWRTGAWDARSVRTFDRLLASFAENGGE